MQNAFDISAEGRISDALKHGFLDLDDDMIKGKIRMSIWYSYMYYVSTTL